MSNSVTKTEEFIPTPHQLLWIDTAIDKLTHNPSIIAQECNISRQSWYRWLKDDNFTHWFRDEWDKRIRSLAWRLDIIGLKKAKEDFRYWQVMQKRVGNINDSSNYVNVSNSQTNCVVALLKCL